MKSKLSKSLIVLPIILLVLFFFGILEKGIAGVFPLPIFSTLVQKSEATMTPTPPATETSTSTATETSTGTATETSTATATETSTATATETSTATSTETSTATATETSTATAMASSTATATKTSTSTATKTSTSTTLVILTTGDIQITRIDYDGVANTYEPDEYVEIMNFDTNSIQLHNWTLRDLAEHVYTFSSFVIAPNQTCRIYTNETHADFCSFNYGSSQGIWNNTRDTAYLKDSTGKLIDEYSYAN